MARSLDQTNEAQVFHELLSVLDITPKQRDDDSNEQTIDVTTKLAAKGLINTANRCFLLSVVQALFACQPFADYVNQASKLIEQSHPTLREASRILAEHAVINQLKPIAPVLAELIAFDIHARHGLTADQTTNRDESTQPIDQSTSPPGDLIKPDDVKQDESSETVAIDQTNDLPDQIGDLSLQDDVDVKPSTNHPVNESVEVDETVVESFESSNLTHSTSKSSRRRRRKKGLDGIDAVLNTPQPVSQPKHAPVPSSAVSIQPNRTASVAPVVAKKPHDPTAAFLPSFPHLLSLFQPRHQGRQEDVAELLLFIINQCQREIETIRKHRASIFGSPVHQTSNGDDDWVEVGSRSKALPVRSNVKIEPTPIANMFALTVRSKLSVASKNAGSISFQPFFILPLDLSDDVRTLEHAIDQFMSTTSVDGFRTSANATRAKTAHQSQSLDASKLPHILTFQLKRFDTQSKKIARPIKFDTSLTLRSQWLCNANSLDELRYDLAAVIVHHGASVQNGHYTAFVRRHARSANQSVSQGWLHMDDSRVTSVTDKAVMLTPAYILMYTRAE